MYGCNNAHCQLSNKLMLSATAPLLLLLLLAAVDAAACLWNRYVQN
jgi:hypothetical protein